MEPGSDSISLPITDEGGKQLDNNDSTNHGKEDNNLDNNDSANHGKENNNSAIEPPADKSVLEDDLDNDLSEVARKEEEARMIQGKFCKISISKFKRLFSKYSLFPIRETTNG